MHLPINNPLTVLFLISSEGYFGAENMLVTQAASLSRLGCHCVIGVFRDARFPHTEVADHALERGLHVEVVPCAARCDRRAVSHIRKMLEQYHVDILHPHGYKADLYAYAAARSHRVGLVATSHNWPSPKWKMRAYAALDRRMLRGFDRIVVVSEHVAEILRRSGISASKVRTIFNGVQIERFASHQATFRAEVAAGDEAVVGFVGRFVPDKGGSILLRAAKKVLGAHPSTKFVFVGDGPSRREWESFADQLGIRSCVSFSGVRQDMPGVYASLDLLVLPSLCEAMPMCLLEAMAAGKPVIASRLGAVPQLVVPENTGLLVEPGNVEELSVAMLQLLGNPERARRMGENAQGRVAEHFSADTMARQYLKLYREVVQIRKGVKKTEMTWELNA